ncbi:hypothetical protein BpHYR1_030479 [Brachionus plicatilis]|uniref:Uncharacterized protein n=1 Tax=Brachionus plicatilis TaxID=10195 RepID=A0A3M7P837_BRAPC|nr:hypothetical protein BpHYR1_030479 [Brachionus plicatilis]
MDGSKLFAIMVMQNLAMSRANMAYFHSENNIQTEIGARIESISSVSLSDVLKFEPDSKAEKKKN